MSFASLIVRRFTGILKLGSQRANLKYPSHEEGKLRGANISDLRDPRFTRDQLEKLTTQSTDAEHSAGRIAGESRFRR